MKLFIVRHGETVENAARIVMGQREGQLSARGRQQARDIARRLNGEHIDCIYTSDLGRAVETAKILSESLGSDMRIERRLREQHFGGYEGRPFMTLLRHIKKTGEEFISLNPPGGEPSEAFRHRVSDFFGEAEKQHRQDSIVLVTHYGVITVLLASLLGYSSGLSTKDCLVHGVILLADVDAGRTLSLRYSGPADVPARWSMIRGKDK
ncbi:MAG: histidine phosphatase family protein [Acidobacteriota bacterium]